ncbi:MAG TPA: acyl-CoA dehydrogenase family protein [Acidimicrobiales bacterium]|nr:acyl-CoA dehydrogenase family protein [Acidimicrobiales bacterium]
MTSPRRETVDEFRARARDWIRSNLEPMDDFERADVPGRRDHERALQRKLYDAGFAGICFPAEYGGLGLPPAYQRAFTEEAAGYDMPSSLNVPTFGILAATLLDFGTDEQKRRHIPALLRGEELWVQFLSEPSGGSDLAGVLTRADRDGDVFVLNGSKIWSSGAHECDYAMILARTNWDVPKHRGLTMFILKIHQPGVQVEQIRQVDGSMEFCQEFFDDVHIPVADVVGEIDDGWTVATRLLTHERAAVGGASIYTSGRSVGHDPGYSATDNLITQLVTSTGQASNDHVRQLVAEAHVRQLVSAALSRRIGHGLANGKLSGQAGAIMKLFSANGVIRRSEIGLEIAGAAAAAWAPGDEPPTRAAAEFSLWRQSTSLGGGSNEIQRNIISERVLGMPREYAADREIPYREVKRSR